MNELAEQLVQWADLIGYPALSCEGRLSLAEAQR